MGGILTFFVVTCVTFSGGRKLEAQAEKTGCTYPGSAEGLYRGNKTRGKDRRHPWRWNPEDELFHVFLGDLPNIFYTSFNIPAGRRWKKGSIVILFYCWRVEGLYGRKLGIEAVNESNLKPETWNLKPETWNLKRKAKQNSNIQYPNLKPGRLEDIGFGFWDFRSLSTASKMLHSSFICAFVAIYIKRYRRCLHSLNIDRPRIYFLPVSYFLLLLFIDCLFFS